MYFYRLIQITRFLHTSAVSRVFVVLSVASISPSAECFAEDWKFSLSAPSTVREEPFTGRVYLFFTKGQNQEPRLGPDWFRPEPFVALDVVDWKPLDPLLISPATPRLAQFPQPLADLMLKNHRVQAVIRLNPFDREIGRGTGNAYSKPLAIMDAENTHPLVIDQVVPEREFKNSEHCRELRVKSHLLTQFYGRETWIRAAIQLPTSYSEQPDRRFPIILRIPGFGGTHFEFAASPPVRESNNQGVEFIRVNMDPSCGKGHHVFADSANNGPVGKALVEEFLPELDKQFRTISSSTGRFLTGHSSGGWSSLWLQVTYPDTFGGTWSTSPDSVDFHDFQRVNLYAPGANLFRDEQGQRRPLGRDGNRILLWTDAFCDMEHVLGHGGQMQSFEAVFSGRDAAGEPQKLWDRRTGAIDPSVAAEWKKYDIREVVESNWMTIGPKLSGKIHVFIGSMDTFYLEGATIRLKEALQKLNSDAIVEILPDRNHFNIFENGLQNTIQSQMIKSFLNHHKLNGMPIEPPSPDTTNR